jgi:DNA-binding MarR family transcriptional regulator
MREPVDHVNQSGEPPPEEVFEALHDLMHRYRAQRQRAVAAAGQDLSHMEAKVLGFFARQPEATLSDLVAHSGRDKSQLARLIAGLRERGLLAAQTDARDRRNLRLRCTPAAQEIHRAMRLQSRRLARSALATLDAKERLQLMALLNKLSMGLDASDRAGA